jgi:hypothetical protein
MRDQLLLHVYVHDSNKRSVLRSIKNTQPLIAILTSGDDALGSKPVPRNGKQFNDMLRSAHAIFLRML